MVTLEGGKEALEETKPRAGWKEWRIRPRWQGGQLSCLRALCFSIPNHAYSWCR